MTNLLGSKRWITAVAAAGALIVLSGCTSSDPGGEAADAPSGTASSQAPSPSAEPSPSDSAPADSAAPVDPETPAPAEPEAPAADPAEESAEEPVQAEPPTPTPDAAPPTEPAAPAAAGLCAAAQLTGSVQDQLGGGAAGSVYRMLVLTNASEQDCTVQGYPGVSFVDAAGAQLGAPADRDGSGAVAVTLAPGASATSTLQQTNAQNYGESCDLVPASGLRVYPPGATDSLILPQELPVCSADSIVLMHVGTLQPAA